jgi:hypothetical protein
MPCGYLREFNVLRTKITDKSVRELLTTPTDTYVINTDNHFVSLNKIKSKLKLVEGLYINNSYKPLIEFNSCYFIKNESGFKVIESADDVKITKSDIYIKTNGIFELYMKYASLAKVRDKLTINPSINYVNILLIKELTEHFISSLLNYRYYLSKHNLVNCFKDQFSTYLSEETYYKDFSDLYNEINDFMTDNYWGVYFVKIINSSIIIERTTDYRIYEWSMAQLKEDQEE